MTWTSYRETLGNFLRVCLPADGARSLSLRKTPFLLIDWPCG